MKSAFGSKRRARKIEVNEDDDENGPPNSLLESSEQAKACKSSKDAAVNSADSKKIADT